MSVQTPARDNKHIFSELEDPEKIALINEFFDLLGKSHLERWLLWVLYFRDTHKLRLDIEKVRDAVDSDDGRQYGLWYDLGWVSHRFEEYSPSVFGFISPIELEREAQDPQNPPPQTSNENTRKALVRDGYRCRLTGTSRASVKVAHIIPTYLNGITESDISFRMDWVRLEQWLGHERVSQWKDHMLSEKDGQAGEKAERVFDTDRLSNMIALDSEVQNYWNDDLCAFRPVFLSNSKRHMLISFHWLPLPERGKVEYSDEIFCPSNHHPYPNQKQGCIDTPGAGIYLHDVKTGERIRSGTTFWMSTSDPETKPLPSMELLEIQWYLRRLSRFKGNIKASEEKFTEPPEFQLTGSTDRMRCKWYDGKNRPKCWHYRGREWAWTRYGSIYSDLETNFANINYEGLYESDPKKTSEETSRQKDIEDSKDQDIAGHQGIKQNETMAFIPNTRQNKHLPRHHDIELDNDLSCCAFKFSLSLRR